ncbi:hypothetical protein Smp_076460 [Schistosoma mansoni]|uniref:THAP-type domain-containing protein n=1 Tax=Schistosoma mansoni TaxID=6183 RepID=G4LZH7_SCHMA|nr:hypothetical protein Smp_076460 [Schistosoma mansoni]|eukprot:XP_018646645.1 hypothetical protein Smp_076460 [Schistosoma mansoni]
MDSSVTDISVVQSKHRHASIILCSFPVLRAFFKKKYEYLRSLFQLAYGYIRNRWIARKSMWASCCQRHVLSLSNHTNNRVESARKHLKECLKRSGPLPLTFWKI